MKEFRWASKELQIIDRQIRTSREWEAKEGTDILDDATNFRFRSRRLPGHDMIPTSKRDNAAAAEGRRSTVWTRQPNSFIPANCQVEEDEWRQLLQRRREAKLKFSSRTEMSTSSTGTSKENRAPANRCSKVTTSAALGGCGPAHRDTSNRHYQQVVYLSATSFKTSPPSSERTENIKTASISTSASHATPSVEATSNLQLPLVTSLSVMELSTDLTVGLGHTAASIHANKHSVHGDSSHEQGKVEVQPTVAVHQTKVKPDNSSAAQFPSKVSDKPTSEKGSTHKEEVSKDVNNKRSGRHHIIPDMEDSSSVKSYDEEDPVIKVACDVRTAVDESLDDETDDAEALEEETQQNDEGEGTDWSEYEYTDTDHTYDSSSDSGIGHNEQSKRKVLTKRVPSIHQPYYTDDEDPYSQREVAPFSASELELAGQLKNWVNLITSTSTSPVKDLQGRYESLLPPCKVEPQPELAIRHVTGERDTNHELHGEVEIDYVNGDYFWGDMEHGVKEGMASVVLKNGDNYMGRFKNNQLDGFVQETLTFCDMDNVNREVFYRKGVRHGFYREFGPGKQFWCFGRYSNGKKVGACWRWGRGGVYNVGEIDNDNKPDGDDNTFLYPDLLTLIQGSYNHGKLKSGQLARLIGMEKEYGILVPRVRPVNKTATLAYEPSSSNVITKRPMLRDPYEQRYVYVEESAVPFAGQGLYAKSRIAAGQLVSLFNGVRQRHLWGVKGDNFGWSDYRISVDRDLDIDIRKEHVSLANYRATLSHKTCHSFSPNSHFAQLWHPRFGLIMSIVANRDLEPGEEVFVSYNYDIQKAPEWYQNQWFKHLRGVLDWTEKEIVTWANKMLRKTGVPVKIPPPEKHSSRFVACGRCGEHVGLDCSSVCCEGCELWFHIPCTNIDIQDVVSNSSGFVWHCTDCS